MSAATYPLLKRKNLLNQSIVNWITYDCICAYEHCTRNSTTVEPLYRGHHWDPSGCPVYSGTSLYRTPLGPIWLSCIQWTSLYRTPLGPIWLSCIQWNLSIQDTTGTQLVVLYTVEPLYTGHHWDPSGCPVYSGTSLYRTPLGPSWLSCIQWNLSIQDTTGPIWLSCIEVFLVQR